MPEEIMKGLLFLSILILLIPPSYRGQVKFEDSSIEVLGSKWSKSSRKPEKSDNPATISPQPAMTSANKNFERNRRVNDPVGAPDPNAESIDGRSAALEKNVQESRSAKATSTDGFMYEVKIRNAGTNTIEILFWEYQFTERANPANIMSRQFLCGLKIKPEKEKELKVFSTFSPGSLLSADSLDNKSESHFEEKILINRVEYADGTIWQRKDWSYSKMKPAITHALETPWGLEQCRNLQ
jgi:hypothetical protein